MYLQPALSGSRFSSLRLCRRSVRLRAGAIGGVEVPLPGDARSRVAKGNCAAARRGGEQPEANMQSVG